MASVQQLHAAALSALAAVQEAKSAKPLQVWVNHHPPKPSPLQKLKALAAQAAALKTQTNNIAPMGPAPVNPMADAPSLNPQGLLALLASKGPQDPMGNTN